MNPISVIGAFLITFALLSYGIGSISLQRFSRVSKEVLWFLLIGVLLNISAIICMVFGAQMVPFTLHGFLGYSALLIMLIVLVLVWLAFKKRGLNTLIYKRLHLFARLAYGWWVIAYLTGGLLVILK